MAHRYCFKYIAKMHCLSVLDLAKSSQSQGIFGILLLLTLLACRGGGRYGLHDRAAFSFWWGTLGGTG